MKRQKAKQLIRNNIAKINETKYRKPRLCNCQKCSGCCDRVIAVTASEVESVKSYLKWHPQIKKKIRNILRWVPEYEDLCPFLDLTAENNHRCLLYASDVRFHICKIFSCYYGSSYGEDLEDWREKCKNKNDPAYNLDLRHHFFGAKEDWAKRFEETSSFFTDLFCLF